jgi:hypothetical protein
MISNFDGTIFNRTEKTRDAALGQERKRDIGMQKAAMLVSARLQHQPLKFGGHQRSRPRR